MCPTALSPHFLSRTPGKAILAGEHFVLHGAPALAVPVHEFQLTMRVSMRSGSSFALPEPYTECSAQVSKILDGLLAGNTRLWVTSEIPVGAGLGSSAAFAVALGRCLVLAKNGDPEQTALGPMVDRDDEQRARAIAHVIEGSLHGTSSGIDTTTVAEQRPILLRPSESGRPHVTPIAVDKAVRFYLLDSGIRRKTRDQIQKVCAFRAARSEQFSEQIARGVEATELASDSLSKGDPQGLWRAIDNLGALLRKLDLEPSSVTRLREDAQKEGIAVKITGAGGGGFFIAYHPDSEKLESWCCSLPPSYRPTPLNVPASTALSSREHSSNVARS